MSQEESKSAGNGGGGGLIPPKLTNLPRVRERSDPQQVESPRPTRRGARASHRKRGIDIDGPGKELGREKGKET